MTEGRSRSNRKLLAWSMHRITVLRPVRDQWVHRSYLHVNTGESTVCHDRCLFPSLHWRTLHLAVRPVICASKGINTEAARSGVALCCCMQAERQSSPKFINPFGGSPPHTTPALFSTPPSAYNSQQQSEDAFGDQHPYRPSDQSPLCSL